MKQARKQEVAELLVKAAAALRKTAESAAQKPRFTVDLCALKKLADEAKHGK